MSRTEVRAPSAQSRLARHITRANNEALLWQTAGRARCGSPPFTRMARVIGNSVQSVATVTNHIARLFAAEGPDDRALASSRRNPGDTEAQGGELGKRAAPADASHSDKSRSKLEHHSSYVAATTAERVRARSECNPKCLISIVSTELTTMSRLQPPLITIRQGIIQLQSSSSLPKRARYRLPTRDLLALARVAGLHAPIHRAGSISSAL